MSPRYLPHHEVAFENYSRNVNKSMSEKSFCIVMNIIKPLPVACMVYEQEFQDITKLDEKSFCAPFFKPTWKIMIIKN